MTKAKTASPVLSKKRPDWSDLFLRLSVELTGFTAFELHSTGMFALYYQTVNLEKDSENLDAFVGEIKKIFKSHSNNEAQLQEQIGAELISGTGFKGLAKQIILLWYTGIWPVDGVPKMISSASYISGLIWRAAETHPAGALQPGYGSWSEPPL